MRPGNRRSRFVRIRSYDATGRVASDSQLCADSVPVRGQSAGLRDVGLEEKLPTVAYCNGTTSRYRVRDKIDDCALTQDREDEQSDSGNIW